MSKKKIKKKTKCPKNQKSHQKNQNVKKIKMSKKTQCQKKQNVKKIKNQNVRRIIYLRTSHKD